MTAITPDRLLELGTAFWASKTLLSAVELGVFPPSPADRSTPRRCASASACIRGARATSSTPWSRSAC